MSYHITLTLKYRAWMLYMEMIIIIIILHDKPSLKSDLDSGMKTHVFLINHCMQICTVSGKSKENLDLSGRAMM